MVKSPGFIIFILFVLVVILVIASPVLSSVLFKDADTEGTADTVSADYDDPTVPKYGGMHNRIRTSNWDTWDYAIPPYMSDISLMGEELLGGDWTKGPAGTNENDWTSGYGGFTDTLTGRLVENWELPDNETIIYHICQGVHWWDKEPANGRELTAEDIAWNIERHFSSPRSLNYNAYTKTGKSPLSITASDRYTVEVKVYPEWQGVMAVVIGDHMWMLCPDAVEANGGEPLTSWQQFIGTGPFMIENYVKDTYIEYVRNPDYWQTDPFHPENRLPYAEGIKDTIIHYAILDSGTPYAHQTGLVKAALKNGRADTISTLANALTWEEVDELLEEYPALRVKPFAGSTTTFLWPRLDNTELPFNDIRIRQAMNLAINQQEIIDDYYNGHADLLSWPYPDLPVFDRIYTPLEEQSQAVQELFNYNIEKARELMTEAGFQDGFEFTIYSDQSDFLMIIKEYLTNINIDMKIRYEIELAGVDTPKEQVFYGDVNLLKPQDMMSMVEGSPYNYSRVSDSRIQEAYINITRYRGINDTEVAHILKEIGPYQLELAVPVFFPTLQSFVMWWPWLQNYYGGVGGGGYDNIDEYLMYFWIDTDMKTAMGY
jgi:peptide/nickel transport system substrate-binding protein